MYLCDIINMYICCHDSEMVKIREYFVGFVSLEEVTGAFMTQTLIEQLVDLHGQDSQ